MSLSRERLKQLEDIETDVVNVIESASQSLLELSKQQPVEEYVIKRTTEFLKGIHPEPFRIGTILQFPGFYAYKLL